MHTLATRIGCLPVILAAVLCLFLAGCSTTKITPAKYETNRRDFTMRLTPTPPATQHITVTPSPVVIVITPIEEPK